MTEKIEQFRGKYNFLSNFYPCKFSLWGYTWKSSEHAYQASKFIFIPVSSSVLDIQIMKKIFEDIRSVDHPSDAKKIARKNHFKIDSQRFHTMKLKIMELILFVKFDQNPDLLYNLLDTGDAVLEEGNNWNDTFWGVSLESGEGSNHLGKILMSLREEFRKQENG